MKEYLNGTVIPTEWGDVYEWLGEPFISPGQVNDILTKAREAQEPLELVISSGGGSVIAGSEIYEALRNYPGDVTLRIVYAASAASVIAMARHSVAEPTAMLMVHNSSSVTEGDYHDMERAAQMLRTVNEAMSTAYADKTGLSKDEILDLMDKETWLDAEKALELGFIDEVDRSRKKDLAASINGLRTEAEIKAARKQMAKEQAIARLRELEGTV